MHRFPRLAAALASAGLASSVLAVPSPPRPEHEVTRQGLVYRLPGMDRVRVRQDLPFPATRGAGLKFDLYLPAEESATLRPAVVFINGVGDPPGGERLKDWEVYREWGRLVAASGWIGVTAEARGPFRESGPDIRDLFLYLHANAGSLGIDPDRIAAAHADDATAWLRLGISSAHVGRGDEAEKSLRRAVAAGADRPIDLYNVACGLALAGRAEAALDHLERAVAGGFGTRRGLTEDGDLASLRELPRFRALVERLPPG